MSRCEPLILFSYLDFAFTEAFEGDLISCLILMRPGRFNNLCHSTQRISVKTIHTRVAELNIDLMLGMTQQNVQQMRFLFMF